MKLYFWIFLFLLVIIFLNNDLNARREDDRFERLGTLATVASIPHHKKIDHSMNLNKTNFLDSRYETTLKFITKNGEVILVEKLISEETFRRWESGEAVKLLYLEGDPRKVRLLGNESLVFDWVKGWFLAFAAMTWNLYSFIKSLKE